MAQQSRAAASDDFIQRSTFEFLAMRSHIDGAQHAVDQIQFAIEHALNKDF